MASANAEKLLEKTPSTQNRILLARSLAAEAAIHAKNEEDGEAVSLYERANALLDDARTESAHDLRIEQMAATICRSVGKTRATADDFPGALAWYGRAQKAAEILVDDYPSVESFRITYALIAEDIGFLHLEKKEFQLALDHFEQAYAARRQVGEPTTKLRHLIAAVHFDLASSHHREGRMDEAAHSYQTVRFIYDELNMPLETERILPMAQSLLMVGYYQWENGETDRSIATFDQMVGFLEPHIAQQPDYVPFRQMAPAVWLGLSLAHYEKGNLAEARAATDRAIEHFLVAIPFSSQPELERTGLSCAYFQLEGVLRRLELTDEAKRAEEQSKEYRPDTPEGLYALAKNYAGYSKLIGRGKARLEPADLDELARYLDRAVKCLEDAVSRGMENADQFRFDPAFLSLRGHPGFQELVGGGAAP